MAAPGLSLDNSRILLGGSILIYLERTLVGTAPADGSPPRAYGLAPTAIVSDGEALAGIAPGEAIWLGLQAVDRERPARLRVQPRNGPAIDLTCPPDYFAGTRSGDRVALFTTGTLTLSLLTPVTANASIQIVDLETFSAATGEEAQGLDPESGYGGWRLP
jgi:hypothetical protein